MDSVLDKVGLYDFFGVFLSGMLTVVGCFYLDLPWINLIEKIDNEIISFILFMLMSYLLGVILQEISSLIDKKWFKFREKARSNFLNDNNKIVSNELELKSFRKSANKILKVKGKKHVYSKEDNEYVFYHCKTYLEVNGKSGKINRINSLYAMSRSLVVLASIFLLFFLGCNKGCSCTENIIVTSIMVILICIFYKRAERFCQYRVRVTLRHYRALTA